MSDLVPLNIQIPAHLANRIGRESALAKSMTQGVGGEGFPRLSIKGARFRIVEGGSETVLNTTALDVVIVGANPNLSKTWYAKEWNKDAEPAAPDCFSLDGLRPDSASTNPQNDLCASCPHNAWGSKIAPNGQQLKACSDHRRLAVVAADDPEGPIYLLQVTPAALKGLAQYTKGLSARGIVPEIVKTTITFDTDASFPKLIFKFGGFLDENATAVVDALFESDRVLEITGQNASAAAPAVAAKPKPMLVSAAPAPAPKAAPAPAPVEEPAAPKRGFGAAKAAAPAAAPKAKAAAPAAAPAADISSLTDEIAALVGGVDADDA